MRISDWSSDVCSSDLIDRLESQRMLLPEVCHNFCGFKFVEDVKRGKAARIIVVALNVLTVCVCDLKAKESWLRSEEHTSELQSLMRISYAVFCLKKKKLITITTKTRLINKIYSDKSH